MANELPGTGDDKAAATLQCRTVSRDVAGYLSAAKTYIKVAMLGGDIANTLQERAIHPKFLVVDDQPLSAEFLASVARDAGWATEIACTADTFDEQLDKGHPDLIALDLAMPDRDGVELLRQLSAAGYQGKLIIVSGCDEPIVESSALLATHRGLQVTGYAQKPISAEAFTALLDQARPTSDY